MLDFSLIRGAVSGSFRNHRLLFLQLVANPILFALFAAWLLLPVASALHVALNAALAGTGALLGAFSLLVSIGLLIAA